MNTIMACLILVFLATFPARTADAFSKTGCEGDCKQCHSFGKEEAKAILKKVKLSEAKILGIQISPVKGLWEVTLEDKGKKAVLYVDLSKKYLMTGPIIEVSTGSNKTMEKVDQITEKKKVDVSKIPVSDTIIMGKKDAAKRVIVFTDPDCPFCATLHKEITKVTKDRKDIVFHVKLYPLKGHKDAYWKSKSIVCNKSVKMLEDNFEKKTIKKTECDTKEIDDTIKLAESLGITGTPTLVMPDGTVYSGTMPADRIKNIIDGKK
ncbi:MAG TPA: DsbC family protein [Dissulfurispiraceae bacterium]|nr:DsbC family protein [Dissulfurispiraceae bacterium]